LVKTKVQEKVLEKSDEEAAEEAADIISREKSTTNAIAAYRKIKEGKKELTEKEQIILDKECKIVEEREIIEVDPIHEPIEIELLGKGKIQIGPPTLTRFEKARIMGARALQLSLGAPPFIEIPKTARTSLDIAMEELNRRVIPIIIRRVLPNGDYQNIPIDQFI
jgi:DNA-directed RNA polymerase I, II, and III subunit RPABC2